MDPPYDHRRVLGIVLLYGPRRKQFLMSEVPLYLPMSLRCSPPGNVAGVEDVSLSVRLKDLEGPVTKNKKGSRTAHVLEPFFFFTLVTGLQVLEGP